ncbi:hypothetical protein [Alteromonas phage XX1924]|nr:hypothetical protein [Alteromonas phage XX1924]
MAECKIGIKVRKTWLFYALKPVWIVQTLFGCNHYFMIDRAFSYVVVK